MMKRKILSDCGKWIWLMGIFFFTIECSKNTTDRIPQFVEDLENVTIFPFDIEPTSSIELIFETNYRDSLSLEEIPAFTVDNNGDLYFSGHSWKRHEIFIFDQNGSPKTSIGTYGEKSGELLDVRNIQVRSGRLYTFDHTLQRISIFDVQSGELQDTVSTQFSDSELRENQDHLHFVPIRLLSNGSYLIKGKEEKNPAFYPNRTVEYYRMDEDGRLKKEKLFEQSDIQYLIGDHAGKPSAFLLSLPEKPLLTVTANDSFYTARTDEFFIQILDQNGNYSRAYYSPFERTPLDVDELVQPNYSHNDQLLRTRESADYPEFWPALYSMFLDDLGRLWVSTIIADENQLEWWIIKSDKVLARFKWPKEKPIELVKNQKAYTIETNSNGFKEIARYRIEFENANSSTNP